MNNLKDIGLQSADRKTYILEVINSFASQLLKVNTTEDVVWLVAKHAIAQLGYVDCMVYLVNADGDLCQAASEPVDKTKGTTGRLTVLKAGKGISGHVAKTGAAEIIADTSLDKRYVADDEVRYSEIAVPILCEGEVIGVIDSEHPEKDYYHQGDLEILTTIASMTAVKIAQTRAREKVSYHRDQLESEVATRTKELDDARSRLEGALRRERELGDMKSRFVATASHQFRTPLTVIKSNIGLLRMMHQQGACNEQVEKVFGRVDSEVNRMTDLMDEVLLLGKINSGGVKASFAETDLIGVIEPLVERYNNVQEDDRIMEFDIKGTPRSFNIDAPLVEHAISNIISNAFKYSMGKRNPVMKVEFNPKDVTIKIKDYGLGIPENDLENLFIPFHRANNVRNISGTGLGMSIAKEYIEMNKGMLRVESRLYHWTKFTVKIKG